MKPQIFLTRYGDCKKIHKYLGGKKPSYDTIRKCLNGHIDGICSENTAKQIYAAATELGCRPARR